MVLQPRNSGERTGADPWLSRRCTPAHSRVVVTVGPPLRPQAIGQLVTWPQKR